MDDPKEEKIRASLMEKIAQVIKRNKYDERQIIQILRATPDKAKAIASGQLGEFTTSEIRRMLDVLN